MDRYRLESLVVTPLAVPLLEPFVIATARVDVTPSVLVRVTVRDLSSGAVAEGLGEAACLPPVTRETPDSVLESLSALTLPDASLLDAVNALVAALPNAPVARAGIETAFIDALARLEGVPVWRLLGGTRLVDIETDVTLPIADPSRMALNAAQWRTKGFRVFKIKVGRAFDDDVRALESIAAAVPDASWILDANAAWSARDALSFARVTDRLGIPIRCWEQPCARDDLDGMAEVAAALDAPVVADESVRSLDDLARVRAARAADGVNLKLVKSGGPLSALAIGRAARDAGMPLMMGEMVETRLGTAAALAVATALGGADFPDLDTPMLLASDPFEGGYTLSGPTLRAVDAPGLGVGFVPGR